MSPGQALEHARIRPAQALSLEELPVVEFRAVPKGETRQEVVPVEPLRLRQGLEATAAGASLPMRMTFDLSGQILEFPSQGFVERVERAPQRTPRPTLVGFRPKEGCQGIASVALLLDSQIGEQCNRLPGVNLHGRIPNLHTGWPQEVHCQARWCHISRELVPLPFLLDA